MVKLGFQTGKKNGDKNKGSTIPDFDSHDAKRKKGLTGKQEEKGQKSSLLNQPIKFLKGLFQHEKIEKTKEVSSKIKGSTVSQVDKGKGPPL